MRIQYVTRHKQCHNKVTKHTVSNFFKKYELTKEKYEMTKEKYELTKEKVRVDHSTSCIKVRVDR